MTNVRNDRELLIVVRDSLRTNLDDPRNQYENTSREFIHDDEPLVSAKYPRIQIRRRRPSVSEIIDIGETFLEQRIALLDIQFWTKSPFKWKYTDNTYLQDEALVKEYLHKIWVALKADITNLRTTYGITGLKLVEEEEPYLEPDTQRFTGIVSVRFWYFTKAAT